MTAPPLSARVGLKEQHPSPYRRELDSIVANHGAHGAVLIVFEADRVGATASGKGGFDAATQKLADQLLAAIDDGQFDP